MFPNEASTAIVAASVKATGALTTFAALTVPVNVGDTNGAFAARSEVRLVTWDSEMVPVAAEDTAKIHRFAEVL